MCKSWSFGLGYIDEVDEYDLLGSYLIGGGIQNWRGEYTFDGYSVGYDLAERNYDCW